MKRILWTALLALPFCTQQAAAQHYCSYSYTHPGLAPIGVKLHVPGLSFNLFAGGGRTQLGPWYQYWPYEAHFQQGPPLGGGGGPYALTLPPEFGQVPAGAVQYGQPQLIGQSPGLAPPAAQAPQQQPQQAPPQRQAVQQSVFQPVGYFYPQQVPSYWYGR